MLHAIHFAAMRSTVASVLSVAALADASFPWEDGVLAKVNGNASVAWRAAENPRFAGRDLGHAQMLCGVRGPIVPDDQVVADIPVSNGLPADFDSRQQWPGCIGEVMDQGACGSCWAVSSAEAISDRLCIAGLQKTGRATFVKRAPLDVMACHFKQGDYGCLGGTPAHAWTFAMKTGLASDRCVPYAEEDGGPVPMCAEGEQNPCTSAAGTPMCASTCTNGSYVSVRSDRAKMATSYSIRRRETDIQNAIFQHGPVVASFYIFEDFLAYAEGVYSQVTGQNVGRHAVKVIGWGSTPEPHWLVQNSWGTQWGDVGFFKIRRGSNECGIEEAVVAGDVSKRADLFV